MPIPTPDPSATPTPTPDPSATPAPPEPLVQPFPTKNAYQPANTGGYDAFLTRLNLDGSDLIYSTYIGGSQDEGEGRADCLSCASLYDGGAVAVDYVGNAYITGWTESTFVAPLPVESPSPTESPTPDESPSPTESPTPDFAPGRAVVSQGLDELAEPVNFPTKDAVQPQPGSNPGDESQRDAFAAKFNTNASGEDSLVYSTFLGGPERDEGQGIAVDLARTPT